MGEISIHESVIRRPISREAKKKKGKNKDKKVSGVSILLRHLVTTGNCRLLRLL